MWLKRHAERVHPEVVEPLGVTRGDVAGDALFEAELAEDAGSRRPGAACGAGAPPRRCRTSAGTSGRRGPSSRCVSVIGTLLVRCGVSPPRRQAHGRKRGEAGRARPTSAVVGDEQPGGTGVGRPARAPSSGPATNAALANTSARHASPATTVTDASPDSAGAPVRGSMRWCSVDVAPRPRPAAAGCWWRPRPRRSASSPVRAGAERVVDVDDPAVRRRRRPRARGGRRPGSPARRAHRVSRRRAARSTTASAA